MKTNFCTSTGYYENAAKKNDENQAQNYEEANTFCTFRLYLQYHLEMGLENRCQHTCV